MLDLQSGKHFGKNICYHIISRTIDQLDSTFLNDPADKVIMNVNVLSAGVELMVTCQSNCGLIIGEKCCGVELCGKYLGDKRTKPKGFFHSMNGSNVLGFQHGQGYKLLFLGTPRNSSSVDNECIS
jgi:hypothetical protein